MIPKNDNLLNNALTSPEENSAPEKVPEDTPVPEKFLDKNGQVNVDSLVKSYVALEKKLGAPKQTPKGTLPANAEGYQITPKTPLLSVDKDINQRLFDLGLTNEQAQGIYDLAADKIIPQLQELGQAASADRELQALEQEFGGAERFNQIARQISAWGEKNLDSATFNTLASSKNGILT